MQYSKGSISLELSMAQVRCLLIVAKQREEEVSRRLSAMTDLYSVVERASMEDFAMQIKSLREEVERSLKRIGG